MFNEKEYMKRYYKNNRERLKEKRKEYHKQWYKNNREKEKEKHKQYRENNHNKIREYFKQYYKKNHKKVLERIKEYRINNPEKRREWENLRLRTDLGYKLNKKMSLLIRQSLKRNKNSNCWEILVEYNVTELKSHLIKTLPEGYIWQDYLDGKIQIDHIIPIRTFKFQNSEDEEFKQCWALKNLRLLTIKENLNKGSKLIKP